MTQKCPNKAVYTLPDDILEKAREIINGERQGQYGNAENSFKIIASLWNAYLFQSDNHADLNESDVANMMILLKVARNANGVYKEDNWIDICGYAALGGAMNND